MISRALLLVGSPRGRRSTSTVLANALAAGLHKHGVATDTIYLKKPDKDLLVQKALEADLLIFSFPLYFDSVPFCVARTFEQLYALFRESNNPAKPAVMSIANSGFPEAHQNDVALAVCRHFALDSGCRWLGSLALGGGEGFKGRPLGRFWPLTAAIGKALRLTAAAVAAQKPVPTKAVRLMGRPWLPALLYKMVAAFRWYRLAYRHHSHKNLLDTPYLPKERTHQG